jgi:hypothetical protein
MATSKVAHSQQVVSNPAHYRRFNVKDELTRAVRCDGLMCDVCDHGTLLFLAGSDLLDLMKAHEFLAGSDLLDLMKAHEQRERRIRRARRRGNLIMFPKAV